MIVGFAGYAGAGKDTAAAALVAMGFRQDSLAAPLKAMALDINPWIRIPGTKGTGGDYMDHLFVTLQCLFNTCGHDWEKVKKYEGARQFLQRLGTEAVRKHIGEDIWASLLEERYIAAQHEANEDDEGQVVPFVVADVRFPNEAKLVIEYDGPLIWVDRPGVGPVNGHVSDAGLVRELCTHEIVNDGGEFDLHNKVLEAVFPPHEH